MLDDVTAIRHVVRVISTVTFTFLFREWDKLVKNILQEVQEHSGYWQFPAQQSSLISQKSPLPPHSSQELILAEATQFP